MPTYVYEHQRTGKRIERICSVRQRDEVPAGWRRVLVPGRLAVHMHGRNGNPLEINLVEQVQKGLRREEERHGAGVIARKFGMSTKQIKRVWNDFNQNDQPREHVPAAG